MNPSAIRELRQRLGETQTQFGARFQVSQITVGYWENGRSQPTRQRLTELAALASRATPVKPLVTPFRPIQYLGSKQRLAGVIANVVNEVAPGKTRIGDLFAGSSVVSALLGIERPVAAIDVQTYSKVLSEAVLLGQSEAFFTLAGDEFLQMCKTISADIEKMLAPLLDFEREAEAKAAAGDPEELVQLTEFGSIAVHNQRPLASTPANLGRLLKDANCALAQSQLSPAAVTATRYFGGTYFSYKQAIALDAIYIAAQQYLGAPQNIAVLATILSTASEIVNTVGKQFAQPMKLKRRTTAFLHSCCREPCETVALIRSAYFKNGPPAGKQTPLEEISNIVLCKAMSSILSLAINLAAPTMPTHRTPSTTTLGFITFLKLYPFGTLLT